jgi:hypothetical protein
VLPADLDELRTRADQNSSRFTANPRKPPRQRHTTPQKRRIDDAGEFPCGMAGGVSGPRKVRGIGRRAVRGRAGAQRGSRASAVAARPSAGGGQVQELRLLACNASARPMTAATGRLPEELWHRVFKQRRLAAFRVFGDDLPVLSDPGIDVLEPMPGISGLCGDFSGGSDGGLSEGATPPAVSRPAATPQGACRPSDRVFSLH